MAGWEARPTKKNRAARQVDGPLERKFEVNGTWNVPTTVGYSSVNFPK